MKKLKKLREEFKEQNLLGKTRILFLNTVTFIIIGILSFIAIYLLYFFGNYMVDRYIVSTIKPLSNEYSLLTYESGGCRIVRREDNKKLGKRFYRMDYEETIRDSLVFLYKRNGDVYTFSLKTGTFSEDGYDHIELPDPIHHYCACSKKGLLGFLDCHTGKLVIPMKFYENNYFYLSERRRSGRLFPLHDYPEPQYSLADAKYVECCEVIEECRQDCRYDMDDTENEGIIQFKGDYCIVPTTVATSGIIDINGKLLLDGYDWIEYIGKHQLFKTVRNRQYSLLSAEGMKPLLSGEGNFAVLPMGILLSEKDLLLNHACTDTLTNLVIDGYECDIDLDDFGYGDYKILYKDNDANDWEKTYHLLDNRYKLFRNKSTKYKAGVKDIKSGKIVVEPIWTDVCLYKNDNNKYLFSCSMNNRRFLLDENGNFLWRK